MSEHTTTGTHRHATRTACVLLLLLAACHVGTADVMRLADRDYNPVQNARNDHYDVTFRALPKEGQTAFDSIDVVFGVVDGTTFARLIWDDAGLRLEQMNGDTTAVLTQLETALPEPMRTGCDLAIRRREHVLEVIADGSRVLRILADGIGEGRIGFATGQQSARIDDLHYQRVEPIVFADDFMRTEEEALDLGLWNAASGTWKMYSVMERIQANPDARIREGREPAADRSPNPFCLSGHSTGATEALVLTGYPFWNDYEVGVSVKSFQSDFGLIFAAQDETTFWLVKWGLHSLGNRANDLKLIRRENGVDTVLAQTSAPGRAEDWYRLQVRTQGSRIDVSLDGETVLTHWDARCVGGIIGLYAQGENETYFDDVRLRSVQTVPVDRTGVLVGHAQEREGSWAVDGRLGRVVLRGEPETRLGFAGQCFYTIGRPTWPAQCFRASVPVGDGVNASGLAVAVTGDDYWLAVVTPGRDATVELRRITNGESRTVAASAIELDGRERVELAVDCRSGNTIRITVDGELCIRHRPEDALDGAVGLYAEGRDNCTFSSIELFAQPARDWEQPVDIERFANDPYMQGWASPRYAWLRVEESPDTYPQHVVHKGDFYGAFTLTTPIQNGLQIFFGQDRLDPENSYAVSMTVDESLKSGTVTVTRAGTPLGSAPFTPAPPILIPGQQIVDEKIGAQPRTPDTESFGTLELNRDGHEIWVTVGDTEILALHEDAPLSGRAVAMQIPKPVDFFHVGVVREKVRDYLFERAAVDWLSVGEWEVTNRFACDPRWSHLNGRSKGVAALWNKHEFDGDFTIEYYAGMRMRQGDMMEGAARMYYPRVGDINVAINADGHDLFSGYNVMIAAWDPMWSEKWTQFWKKGEVLEQTDREFIPRGRHFRPQARVIEVAWDPGGRPIHGAWYAVKVRKTGPRYDVSFDNVPVFSVTDPDPIAGKRIALWTQHNSIVIARAKIGYRRISRAPIRPVGGPELTLGQVARPQAVETLPRLSCSSHPSGCLDFEASYQGVAPWAGDQSAELSRVPAPENGIALRLENLYAGGDAGVKLPLKGMDLGRVARFEMDCAIPAQTKVNLYFTLEDDPVARYFVTLSGPDNESPNLTRIGRFEGFRSDGTWQHVSIDLAAALRTAFPWRRSFVTDSVMIGMLHEGYLNAGLGGNPEGAWYELDTIRTVGIGPMEVAVEAIADEEADTEGDKTRIKIWTSREPQRTPPEDVEAITTADIKPLTLDQPGLWTVNSCVVRDNGAHLLPPLLVLARRPAAVAATIPADGQAWGGDPLQIQFEGEGCALPDLATVKLMIDGKHLVRVDETTAAFDPEKRAITVDPAHTDFIITDGQAVAFDLSFADLTSSPQAAKQAEDKDEDDKAKNEESAKADETKPLDEPEAAPPVPERPVQTLSWKAVGAVAKDTTPPAQVVLDPLLYRKLDFNTDLGSTTVRNPDSQVVLRRVLRDADTGDYAMQVLNRLCGSDFGVALGFTPFKAGTAPILAFDYRIGPHAKIDIEIRGAGKHTIGLTDCEETGNYLGAVEGIVDDNTWRHAEVPLSQLLGGEGTNAARRYQSVQQIAFGDWGYAGDAPGATYELDNIAIVPTVGTHAEPLGLNWSCADLGGIRGYSYEWTREPDSEPDKEIDTVEQAAQFRDIDEGQMFFHIRACDRAGNWGPASHYRFLVDNTPPAIVGVTPAKDDAVAADKIKITFAESLAPVDPSTLTITVNGRKQRLQANAIEWNSTERVFTWDMLTDWQLLRRNVDDGQKMEVVVSGAADAAGNKAEPYTWSWTVDYSKDTEGPPPPYLYSYSHNFRNFDHFADGTGYWRAYNSPEDTTEKVVRDPDTGSDCLEVRKTGDGRRFGAYRYRGKLSLDDFPYLYVDYKIMPGTKINILLYINKAWHIVRMTGSTTLPVIGTVEGAADDGAWHNAMIDLRKIVRDAFPDEEDEPEVRLVAFAEWGADNDVGQCFYIDNFAYLGPSAALPVFSYSAADATGIAQYELGFDMAPKGNPKETTSSRTSRQLLAAADKAGLWYIHARAQDGAGNWGEEIHYPYLCTQPAPAHKTNGLEAKDGWKDRSPGKRTVCYVHPARAGKTNELLGVQVVQMSQPNVIVGCPVELAPEKLSAITADLYLEGKRAVPVAAYIRVEGVKKRILSEKIDIDPGTWTEDQRFVFKPADLKAAGMDGESPLHVKEIGVIIYPHKRTRDLVLLDQIGIDGELQPPAED